MWRCGSANRELLGGGWKKRTMVHIEFAGIHCQWMRDRVLAAMVLSLLTHQNVIVTTRLFQLA